MLSLYCSARNYFAALSEWRQIERNVEDLKFEIDLLRFPVTPRETRAEKTLLQHSKHLLRYYNQNLSENKTVLWVGVGCIILGIVILGITIYLIGFKLGTETKIESKIIIGFLGTVGSLLTNYVAAIYLKMHAAASTNLGKFHSRLVETHQMFFSNLIASRIGNDKVYWDTLSKVAVNLSRPLGYEPVEKSSSPKRHLFGKSKLSRKATVEEHENEDADDDEDDSENASQKE